MRVHKRTKSSRIRGSTTAGWGFRQKHKGHGNKGGFGMGGSGAHKRQSTAMSVPKGKKYFGKQGVTSMGTAKDKTDKINLYTIENNLFTKEGCKIDLSKYKILGTGNGFNAEIVAMSASKSAIEKMKKAGGKIILPNETTKVKQWIVKESDVASAQTTPTKTSKVGKEKTEKKK